MAASSSSVNNVRDLTILHITFAYVEKYIKSASVSSGSQQMSKGFKYYSEQYVHSMRVYADTVGSFVQAKCYRSQKKSESPHDVKVMFQDSDIVEASCSCVIGKSGNCGHVTALLYQIANYKQLDMKYIPVDIAKTSLPQTWHVPRGEKLRGDNVDNIVVQGYDRSNPYRTTKGIKSTLYNPLSSADDTFDAQSFTDTTKGSQLLFSTLNISMKSESQHFVQTDFLRGSGLSYQSKLSTDYVINLYDSSDFPNLPLKNVMENHIPFVLNDQQFKKFESLEITEKESLEIEQSTRDQSRDPKWHKLRQSRITATSAGEIAKKRADGSKLAERLMTVCHVQTAAMKPGLEFESTAVQKYSKVMDDGVN